MFLSPRHLDAPTSHNLPVIGYKRGKPIAFAGTRGIHDIDPTLIIKVFAPGEKSAADKIHVAPSGLSQTIR